MPALAHYGGQAPLLPPAASVPSTTLLQAAPSPASIPSFETSAPLASFPDSTDRVLVDQPSIIPPAASPADLLPYEIPEPSGDSRVGGFLERCEVQMLRGRHVICTCVSSIVSFLTIFGLLENVAPSPLKASLSKQEEESWVATSSSWVDRTGCRWFGICGVSHLNKAGWATPSFTKGKSEQPLTASSSSLEDKIDLDDFWHSAKTDPREWSQEERRLREVPDYVLEYAPYVHLFSGEEFWPCDIAEHLLHTTPHLNYTPMQADWDHPTLENLDELNKYGRFTYLKSNDNVEDRPEWLGGSANIPDPIESDGFASAHDDDAHWDGGFTDGTSDENAEWYEVGIGDTIDRGGIRPPSSDASGAVPSTIAEGEELLPAASQKLNRRNLGKRVQEGGRSDAPAVLIVVDKGHGVVDAFWFYFYSYNLGNVVLNVRFGNHVGDWEHSAVRFHHGKPKAVYFSEHNFGEAYGYDAVEKIGKRPVVYSATGTHAMYATPGLHPYVLPWGLLHDETDRGPLWDPALNHHSYTYDYRNDTIRSSTRTPKAPTEWFHYIGHWGDKFYPLDDPRQYRFAGQYHYVNGPLGPRFKNLGRKKICPGNDQCVIKHWTGFSNEPKYWDGPGKGEGEEIDDMN